MSIKSIEIIPEANDPFGKCKLNREPYADVLTSIVENYADGFVLALDNEWGTGKTTFIKMWCQYLEDREFSTLYFNAWENDFENDVLVALISELKDLKESKSSEVYKTLLKKSAVLAKKVGPGILSAALKKYTDYDAKELQSVLEGTSEIAFDALEQEINAYTKRKDGIKNFRIALEKYLEEVGKGKPVIFFIDELDRCRPNYAVEVLEQIKHLFSVDGVVFVLSIDKEQLGHAIRGVYGSEQINAEEYLRRFFDVEYSLPDPKPENYIDFLYTKYDLKLFFESELRVRYGKLRTDNSRFKETVKSFFTKADLNLRHLEKLFIHTSLVVKTVKANNYIFPHLLFYLIYLKHFHKSTYKSIVIEQLSPQELIHELEETIPKTLVENEHKFFISIFSDLLCQYVNNLRYLNEKDIYEKKEEEDPRFLLNTKFDKELYARFIQSHYSNWDTDLAELRFLTDRINLTEQMIDN